MLFLACLFFIDCFYASEADYMLKSVVINDQNTELLEALKKNYQSYIREIQYDKHLGITETTFTRVYFYDPLKKKAKSFTPNKDIQNIFTRYKDILNICSAEDLSFGNVMQSQEMENFCKKNQLNTNLLSKFTVFFKAADAWYNHSYMLEKKWQSRWIYNLSHFLYTILSCTDISKHNSICDHFLHCFKKDVDNLFNDTNNEHKGFVFLASPFMALLCMSGAVFTVAVSTGFTMIIPQEFNPVMPALLAFFPPLPVACLTRSIFCYVRNNSGYKKFLKNIESLAIEEESDTENEE